MHTNKTQLAMKKIILLPKTDTVTLCLPEEWVGVPVICKFQPINTSFLNGDEMETELEKIIIFRNCKRKAKNK
jgi:hypothetical protein